MTNKIMKATIQDAPATAFQPRVFEMTVVKENGEKDISEIEKIFLEKASDMGDRGALLWPLRVSLTGKKHSPGPFEVISILGIDEAKKRLQAARARF